MQQEWDVVVCFDHGHVGLDCVQALRRQYEQQFALIHVTTRTEVEDPLSLWRDGVYDCVHGEDSRRLPLAVLRAARQQTQQRLLRRAELAHAELERRHDLLLSTSTTPIGYLQDGVHLYCNDEYASFFGYDSAATVVVKPFLNLLAVGEREAMKPVLRQAAGQAQALTVQALCADGSEVTTELQLSPVDYHGKACLQVRLAVAAANPAYNDAVTRLSHQDLVTRVANRVHFLVLLEAAIRKAVQFGHFSTLLIIEITDFAELKAAIGTSDSNFLLHDIASFLQGIAGADGAAGRLEEAQFGVLIANGNADETLQLTTLAKERCNSYLSAAMPNSLTLQCHVGMALVNGLASTCDALLVRARHWLGATTMAHGQHELVEAATGIGRAALHALFPAHSAHQGRRQSWL
jgi:PAS domain S-box-containing protein